VNKDDPDAVQTTIDVLQAQVGDLYVCAAQAYLSFKPFKVERDATGNYTIKQATGKGLSIGVLPPAPPPPDAPVCIRRDNKVF
jgi:hypothetical protein